MRNKPLYLKLLFKDFKPDEKCDKLIIGALADAYIKPIEGKKDTLEDSREFILKHTEDFLGYAIDYSMADKFNDWC